MTGPVILIGTTTLWHSSILSDDLTVPVVAFCSHFCRSMVFSGTVHWFEPIKPMYCSREYHTSTRLIQQYEKSTLHIFMCKLGIYHPFVYNNSFLCPRHMKVKTSFGYLCQK